MHSITHSTHSKVLLLIGLLFIIDEVFDPAQSSIKSLLATFGTMPAAIPDVVTGKFIPSGKMPFSTPISDAAAQNQQSDVPGSMEEKGYALFKFDEGLNGF